jgi:hypothetical protein
MTLVTTAGLLQTTLDLLTDTTAASGNVYGPGDWSTWDGGYPYIRVRPLREHKESQGNGGINFEVTSIIRVTARVSSPAMSSDAGAAAAEAALWALGRQIEVAVINAYSLKAYQLSEFPFVDTQVAVSAEGNEHYAELVMDIAMQFYQGPEAFAQAPQIALTQITIDTDLLNVFDATGSYTGAEFPGLSAPRQSGPDGRMEGGLDITLPQ